MGEDYGKEEYEKDERRIAYYQTGSVYDLINISRALFLIHHLLETEMLKTDSYMYEGENGYAKNFNIFKHCTIEIKRS